MAKRSLKKARIRTGLFFSLFSLPFAAIGMVATWTSWHSMEKVDAMRAWVEVPATIRRAELKTDVRFDHGYQGRQGPRSRIKRTYRIIAVYDYEFGGRRYTGDHVSVYGDSESGENMSSFFSNAYRELQRHRDLEKPFRCFVNPRQPTEAVLYRDLRWGMAAAYTLFATLFGAIGLGMLTGVLVSAWRRPRLRAAKATSDAPWLARADWAAGKIQPRGGAALTVPVLAVLVTWWTVASLPLVTRLPDILESARSPFAAVTLVFPAVGIGLLLALVYQLIRMVKFGQSVLELESIPGVVGGQLAGVVRIPRQITASEGFRLKLSCIENADADQPLWRKQRRVTEPMRDHAGTAIAVPVLFEIPYKAEQTSPANADRQIRWRLEVAAEISGVNYDAQFDVPVFKTAESRPDFEFDEQRAAKFEKAPRRDMLFRAAGIMKEPLPGGGVRMLFPAARNIDVAILLTVIIALWSGAIWLLVRAGWIVVPTAFAAIDLFLIWWAARMWLYRSIVEARPDGLMLQGGLLGFGRQRFIPADEIEKIWTGYSWSESDTMGWNKIVVVLGNKKQRMIARSIEGRLTPRAVVAELKAALGRRKAKRPRSSHIAESP